MTHPVLAVSGLHVGYGRNPDTLSEIDLTLAHGVWLGLLGANGSGKSTLLKAITGQIRPRAGGVAIDGFDMRKEPVRAKAAFGYAVPPEDLPRGLSGAEYLQLVASARGLKVAAWDDGDLLALLGMEGWLRTPLEACSLGTRAKFSICAALLGAPRLVILDETLNALDPLSNWQVRSFVDQRVRANGCSVILATHALDTVIATCSRAVFLDGGQMMFRWGPADLEAARTDRDTFEHTIMEAILSRRRAHAP